MSDHGWESTDGCAETDTAPKAGRENVLPFTGQWHGGTEGLVPRDALFDADALTEPEALAEPDGIWADTPRLEPLEAPGAASRSDAANAAREASAEVGLTVGRSSSGQTIPGIRVVGARTRASAVPSRPSHRRRAFRGAAVLLVALLGLAAVATVVVDRARRGDLAGSRRGASPPRRRARPGRTVTSAAPRATSTLGRGRTTTTGGAARGRPSGHGAPARLGRRGRFQDHPSTSGSATSSRPSGATSSASPATGTSPPPDSSSTDSIRSGGSGSAPQVSSPPAGGAAPPGAAPVTTTHAAPSVASTRARPGCAPSVTNGGACAL